MAWILVEETKVMVAVAVAVNTPVLDTNVKLLLASNVLPPFIWIAFTLPPGLFVPEPQPRQVVTVKVPIVELGVRNCVVEASPLKEMLPEDDAQNKLFETYLRLAIKLPLELAEIPEESNVPAIES